MGHYSCCVVNCENTSRNSNCKFYLFPVAAHKLKQRNLWIAAVRKINSSNTSIWNPTQGNKICSAHFIGNAKAEEELSPSYVPRKFASQRNITVINEAATINRHKRFMKRREQKSKMEQTRQTDEQKLVHNRIDLEMTNDLLNMNNYEAKQDNSEIVELHKVDQGCQVETYFASTQSTNTLVCNRYIHDNGYSEAEVQTDITVPTMIKIPNKNLFKNKSCNTPQKSYIDQSVGSDLPIDEKPSTQHFAGIESVKDDEQLSDIAGVSFSTFRFLLKRLEQNSANNCKISIENRLFIFLTKMKTGMTFCALSVFFSVHRTTISRIFFETLQNLASTTASLVFWPDKEAVQGTLPECFYPDYINTRVIIDCTEFRIETPAGVDKKIFCYSHYKKGFTAKVLIGITPAGFICFKSKVAGGRKSDSQLTIESGLLDLLEDGDVVMADKGFPEIKPIIDAKGTKAFLVMPPFLKNKTEFTETETEDTYKISRRRIHVERIMQRIRIYNILNKVPHNLFSSIDDILHMCCVLVNLQSPIITDRKVE